MGKVKFPLRAASIQFFGRITRDPETKYIYDKASVGFSCAVERWDGKARVTSFFNCRAFGQTAEKFKATKGDPVYVTGEPYIEKWETRDGEKKESFKVFVQSCDVIEWADNDAAPPSKPKRIEEKQDPDDDLPF